MKKLILASAIAALSVSAAQAAPTVYGKVGAQLNFTDQGNGMDSEFTLDNDGTRFGLKGAEALTANTDLIYKLEYGLKVDNGSANFTSRDTYLGLENAKLGTVKAGRITSIDDNVDFSNPTELGGGWAFSDEDGSVSSYDEARWNDSLVYESPKMSGLQFFGQVAVDDNEVAEEGSYALAGKYEGNGFGVGVSYVDLKKAKTNFPGSSVDTAVRISGAYDLTSQLTLSGLYQATDFNEAGAETEDRFTIGGEYDVANTPWSLNAQYDMVDNYGGAKSLEGYKLSGGAEYAFTKATTGKIYAGITDIDGLDDNIYQTGVGIVHAF